MARYVANVDIRTETFETLVYRTNILLDSFSKEIITANSTVGLTGSAASPRNAFLYGAFGSNSLSTQTFTIAGNNLSVNSSLIVINNNLNIQANNRVGLAGQVLTSGGAGGNLYWQTLTGTGTVTQVANGVGLVGGPITSSGTLSVKAGVGIYVDAQGVNVNSSYITGASSNASFLQGKTWAAPLPIGTVAPSTGKFTSLSVGTSDNLTVDSFGNLNTSGVLKTTTSTTSPGLIVSATPGSSGVGQVQFVDSTKQIVLGTLGVFASSKLLRWDNSFHAVGSITSDGNITAYFSDERLKEKINDITGALDKVLSLNGFIYKANDVAKSYGYSDDEMQVGVSAQEVQAVLPEIVSLAPFDRNEDGTSKSGNNYLTVDYSKLTVLLIEAMKEQTKRIDMLEEKIKRAGI